ncbi:RICIN domain-containing protein [Saccharothrix obliqua]|uniref:RICIN domain-containing protein n=1 Tax=Saccharothrix obliqua TaxID=2861747 RepID=UPI001C5D3B65|nr:RICIN domain-containing protein [Saccharothrix obliqua]MBW4717265.1 RICIN domain-containing protein [Saccharothrix obliqua]
MMSLAGVAALVAGTFFLPAAATGRTDPVPAAASAPDLARPTMLNIRSNYNNRCLEVRDGNPGNGAMVTMWDCTGWPSELFDMVNGQIVNAINGKCLDVVASNGELGGAVNMFDCHREWPSQQWWWDGSQIRTRLTGRCLEISAANPGLGATVQLWNCTGTANQQWRHG